MRGWGSIREKEENRLRSSVDAFDCVVSKIRDSGVWNPMHQFASSDIQIGCQWVGMPGPEMFFFLQNNVQCTCFVVDIVLN